MKGKKLTASERLQRLLVEAQIKRIKAARKERAETAISKQRLAKPGERNWKSGPRSLSPRY